MKRKNLQSKKINALSKLVLGVGVGLSLACILAGIATFGIGNALITAPLMVGGLALGVCGIAVSTILQEKAQKVSIEEIRQKKENKSLTVSKFEYEHSKQVVNIQYNEDNKTNTLDNENIL